MLTVGRFVATFRGYIIVFFNRLSEGKAGSALLGLLTCHFCASLKHKYDGQIKFIKPNSQRQDIIIKYGVSIGSIHREQG